MLYLYIKAAHLAAVLTWAGGLLALSLLLGSLTGAVSTPGAHENKVLQAVYRWDRRVTTPALGVVWLLGITLAVMGGWYSAPWFWLKFVLVFLLSGLHGHQSATLRRMRADPARTSPAYMRPTAGLSVAALAVIALIVILKPSGAL